MIPRHPTSLASTLVATLSMGLALGLGGCERSAPAAQVATSTATQQTPMAPSASPVPQPQPYAVAAPVYTAPAAQVAVAAPRNGTPAVVAPQVAAPMPMPTPPRPVTHAAAAAGRIASIQPIREQPRASGAGAVLGGVLGAVVGNHFGHGNGRAAMTVLGAGGGALAGNTVERRVNERVVGYRVAVRMDNGTTRVYDEPSVGGLQAGDRVRVEGHRLIPG